MPEEVLIVGAGKIGMEYDLSLNLKHSFLVMLEQLIFIHILSLLVLSISQAIKEVNLKKFILNQHIKD